MGTGHESPGKLPPRGEGPHDVSPLPVRWFYPVIAGALAGLVLRLIFSGSAGSALSPMVAAFIFGAPLLVSVVTVYLAERVRRRTWAYYFAAPFLANLLFIIGTLLLMIEGWICAMVVIPMFAILGGLGGLLMGCICRMTNWPRPTLYCAGALPLLLAFAAPLIPTPSAIGSIERTIVVEAPAAIVWQSINDIRNIRGEEMEDALALRIGVPQPISGVTEDSTVGRVRASRWGKQVYFDEVIQEWEPERYLRWTYRFHPDSFPRRALDDHVVIGGHYFDLLDTSYTLEPLEGGAATRLSSRTRYKIATQFNFYANWVAQILVGNLNDVGLALYKSRSEQTAGAIGEDAA